MFESPALCGNNILELKEAGFQFIATRSDKTVLSYDPLTAADAITHTQQGGHLAWRHPQRSTADVDTPRHRELVYEIGLRQIPISYSPSRTRGRTHVILPLALDDYDWKGAHGFGEVRHWRYTQVYQFDALARAMDLETMPHAKNALLNLLPPASPQLTSRYPGTELRVKAFVCRLLNEDFDWQAWTAGNGIPHHQALAQWRTGQWYADRKLQSARDRAMPLTTLPRSRNLYAAYALMIAIASHDECWLSQRQIARALDIHRRSAGRILQRLVDLGYLQHLGYMPNLGQGRDVAKWRLVA